jgi:hypothetical protein
MALGTQFNIEIHRGDGKTITFNVVDQQTPAQPVNLTGATLEWNYSLKQADAVEPLGASILSPNKTVGAGITVTDAVNGVAQVDLASADTVGQRATLEYYHELQVTISTVPVTTMFGVFKLKKELIAPGA